MKINLKKKKSLSNFICGVVLGQELGSEICSGLETFVGNNKSKHKKEREHFGRVVGSYLPFGHGGIGRPEKRENKTQIMIVHKGESIISQSAVKYVSKS